MANSVVPPTRRSAVPPYRAAERGTLGRHRGTGQRNALAGSGPRRPGDETAAQRRGEAAAPVAPQPRDRSDAAGSEIQFGREMFANFTARWWAPESTR